MKLITFLLFVFFITIFTSCGNHREKHDLVEGTPTRADTVLQLTHAPLHEVTTESTDEVANELRR